MDSPEFRTASSNKPSPPRRELQLQGPRPTPLKIRKDSHKIKKPPIHPQNHHQQQQQHALSNQFRPPVIIYTVSPKVIHTNVNDFMTLVQRLTGSSSLISSSSTSTSTDVVVDNITGGAGGGAISPAARFASIERANSFQADKSSSSLLLSQTSRSTSTTHDGGFSSMEGLEISATVERINNSFPGILSPVPSSLPPISPNFFSPTMMMTMDPSNNSSFSFLHDLSSPLFNGTSFFMPSPTPAANFPSPNPHPPFDLFNQFLDF